jgi:outer membrane murein-binding lipoprotein Lpp
MKKKLTATIVFSLLLTACSSTSKIEDISEVNRDDYDYLAQKEQLKLHENIKSIAEKALEAQLVRKQVTNALILPNLNSEQIREAEWQTTHIPSGMERELSIDWNGDPEPLLKTLASHVDYDIDFEGKPYPVSKNIVIYPSRQNVKRLIDEIDRQASGYIKEINIYEDLKFIKVIYQEH